MTRRDTPDNLSESLAQSAPHSSEWYLGILQMVFEVADLDPPDNHGLVHFMDASSGLDTVVWTRTLSDEPYDPKVTRMLLDRDDDSGLLNVVAERPDMVIPRPRPGRRIPVNKMPYSVSQYIFGDNESVQGMREVVLNRRLPGGLRGSRFREALQLMYPTEPIEVKGPLNPLQVERFDNEILSIYEEGI